MVASTASLWTSLFVHVPQNGWESSISNGKVEDLLNISRHLISPLVIGRFPWIPLQTKVRFKRPIVVFMSSPECCLAYATFQRHTQTVLAGLEWKVAFVYIDDILVCSRTLQYQSQILELIRKAILLLKSPK